LPWAVVQAGDLRLIIFPIFALIVSLGCMAIIGYDAWRRPRADRIVWTLAFAIFAIAAGAEVIGSAGHWTPALVRTYYLAGAVLVVGYLALGELYLLAGKQIQRFTPGATLLVTVLAASLVLNASIDKSKLADDGWEAIDRGPGLVAMAVTINALGTFVLIGGALYSAWRFRKQGTQHNRMTGCVLIALGTFIVASGGTLTRFGHREYLYIAMAAGVAVIFAGVVETRRADSAAGLTVSALRVLRSVSPTRAVDSRPFTLLRLPPRSPVMERTSNDMQAVDYLVRHLLPLSDEAVDRECRIWSVERRAIEALDRNAAREVWALRTQLSVDDQARFDELPVAARLQLAELFFDVFLKAEGVEKVSS
jgi:N-terminal 7TM region of histidine kinase